MAGQQKIAVLSKNKRHSLGNLHRILTCLKLLHFTYTAYSLWSALPYMAAKRSILSRLWSESSDEVAFESRTVTDDRCEATSTHHEHSKEDQTSTGHGHVCADAGDTTREIVSIDPAEQPTLNLLDSDEQPPPTAGDHPPSASADYQEQPTLILPSTPQQPTAAPSEYHEQPTLSLPSTPEQPTAAASEYHEEPTLILPSAADTPTVFLPNYYEQPTLVLADSPEPALDVANNVDSLDVNSCLPPASAAIECRGNASASRAASPIRDPYGRAWSPIPLELPSPKRPKKSKFTLMREEEESLLRHFDESERERLANSADDAHAPAPTARKQEAHAPTPTAHKQKVRLVEKSLTYFKDFPTPRESLEGFRYLDAWACDPTFVAAVKQHQMFLSDVPWIRWHTSETMLGYTGGDGGGGWEWTQLVHRIQKVLGRILGSAIRYHREDNEVIMEDHSWAYKLGISESPTHRWLLQLEDHKYPNFREMHIL